MPGPEFLAEDVARAHAQRWFVRENAALWCHGSLPEGLSLPLRSGPRPQRPVPAARPQAGPVWSTAPMGDGAGLLLTGPPRDAALDMGLQILEGRLTDVARTARGLSYSTGVEHVNVGPDRREHCMHVDAREGQAGEVGRILWEQLADLCRTGPTPEEVAHTVAGLAEDLDADPRDLVLGELAAAAFGEVNEVPYRPAGDIGREWAAVRPDDVAAALRTAAASALLVLPGGATLPTALGGIERRLLCGVVPAAPPGREFRPSALRRARDRAARMRYVVSHAGFAEVDVDGDVHFSPWSEIEAVLPDEQGEAFVVVTRDLCGFRVDPAVHGRAVWTELCTRLPGHLWVRRPAGVARTVVPVG